VPAGRHELRFEFEPTGDPDIAHGKGTRAGHSCTSTTI
jgi:arylsulfatase